MDLPKKVGDGLHLSNPTIPNPQQKGHYQDQEEQISTALLRFKEKLKMAGKAWLKLILVSYHFQRAPQTQETKKFYVKTKSCSPGSKVGYLFLGSGN